MERFLAVLEKVFIYGGIILLAYLINIASYLSILGPLNLWVGRWEFPSLGIENNELFGSPLAFPVVAIIWLAVVAGIYAFVKQNLFVRRLVFVQLGILLFFVVSVFSNTLEVLIFYSWVILGIFFSVVAELVKAAI